MNDDGLFWKLAIGGICVFLMHYATIRFYKFKIAELDQKLKSLNDGTKTLKAKKDLKGMEKKTNGG